MSRTRDPWTTPFGDTSRRRRHPRRRADRHSRCEREPALARAINGLGAENVARACRRAGARLVADQHERGVRRREGDAVHRETTAPAPLNAYGISKLDGEWLAAAACPDTLIVRTSWLYGDGGNNFVEKVTRRRRDRPQR